MATLVLNYLASNLSTEWAFEDSDMRTRFSPQKLWDIFEDVPPSNTKEGVHVLPLSEVHKASGDGKDFEYLVECTRNSSAPHGSEVPKLLEGVASLRPPKRIVYTLYGKTYLD